jgi:hypothetical protein
MRYDNTRIKKVKGIFETSKLTMDNNKFRCFSVIRKHHHKKLNEKVLIDEDVNPEDVNISQFDIKDELCPDFWENGRFDKSARRTLLSIARDFIEHLEIEDNIEDITITGSIANYNWDENESDVDLHILYDFSKISDDVDLLKKFFDAERKAWNKEHIDISIYGYPVEIYIQDTKEEHHSSGVYSLLYDEWITEPNKDTLSDKDTDFSNIQTISSSLMNLIDDLDTRLNNCDDFETLYNDADTLFDKIKDIRKSGMSTRNPEMSDGNLIFKTLRRSDYIEKLLDIRRTAYDMINSI